MYLVIPNYCDPVIFRGNSVVSPAEQARTVQWIEISDPAQSLHLPPPSSLSGSHFQTNPMLTNKLQDSNKQHIPFNQLYKVQGRAPTMPNVEI